MAEWYYSDASGGQQGPVLEDAFITAFRAGQIDANSDVWRVCTNAWMCEVGDM
jgi:hypothetical protein